MAKLRLFGTDRLCLKMAEFSEFCPILLQKEVFRAPDCIKNWSFFLRGQLHFWGVAVTAESYIFAKTAGPLVETLAKVSL